MIFDTDFYVGGRRGPSGAVGGRRGPPGAVGEKNRLVGIRLKTPVLNSAPPQN